MKEARVLIYYIFAFNYLAPKLSEIPWCMLMPGCTSSGDTESVGMCTYIRRTQLLIKETKFLIISFLTQNFLIVVKWLQIVKERGGGTGVRLGGGGPL